MESCTPASNASLASVPVGPSVGEEGDGNSLSHPTVRFPSRVTETQEVID